jgi:hypothetical protein
MREADSGEERRGTVDLESIESSVASHSLQELPFPPVARCVREKDGEGKGREGRDLFLRKARSTSKSMPISESFASLSVPLCLSPRLRVS